MTNHGSHILAMFRKPSKSEAIKSLGLIGLGMLGQPFLLYLGIKNGEILQVTLAAIGLLCFMMQLLQGYVRYSRLAAGGPALWVDKDDVVIGIDKTARVLIADIDDYKFIVAPKTQKPLELKLGMRDGKTRRVPLYDLDNIAPLVTFLRRLVPGRAYPAN